MKKNGWKRNTIWYRVGWKNKEAKTEKVDRKGANSDKEGNKKGQATDLKGLCHVINFFERL